MEDIRATAMWSRVIVFLAGMFVASAGCEKNEQQLADSLWDNVEDRAIAYMVSTAESVFRVGEGRGFTSSERQHMREVVDRFRPEIRAIYVDGLVEHLTRDELSELVKRVPRGSSIHDLDRQVRRTVPPYRRARMEREINTRLMNDLAPRLFMAFQ